MSFQNFSPELINSAVETVNQQLLSRRNEHGWWTGRLSTSALSTATAVMALHKAAEATSDNSLRSRWRSLVNGGLQWLADHQNEDGGWGDTVLSISNISTSMLCHAVFRATADVVREQSLPEEMLARWLQVTESSAQHIAQAGGVPAVIRRYGKDHTFSVPILTHCALAGIVEWKDVIPLPFELSCVPHQLYAAVRMPVVSYALPALIAIGQVIFKHQGHWNPVVRMIRRAAIGPSLKVLESIQPKNGGFLEATPLTSFVCMSLLGCGLFDHVVTQRCLQFIEASVREDGSWPIDTNLTTWVTTLSVNALCEHHVETVSGTALAAGVSIEASDRHPRLAPGGSQVSAIRNWLLGQQYRTVHPYTHAAPGGWSWTDLPGGVPDADDTPGAMLAVMNLRSSAESFSPEEISCLRAAVIWLLDLQNRDGGWPTFCRGWGTLPFDRSSCDLTAHTLRAFHQWLKRVPVTEPKLRTRTEKSMRRGIRYLENVQRTDGTWLPLWFGHQFNEDDENPLYGTSRVVRALGTIGQESSACCVRAVRWLIENQNEDGGWSARRGLKSSVEETGLALDSLVDFPEARSAVDRAAHWLAVQVKEGIIDQPSPIGFYFARLWYFEDLYPIIFAAAGLNRWRNRQG
ncbi:MAG: prenyltransferase/squalene oxidase repeat-containing protein [Planctomycetaceae bacterium]